jgi:hypothetical protein
MGQSEIIKEMPNTENNGYILLGKATGVGEGINGQPW